MVDDPIIVTGGSVTVDVSDKFKDNGHAGGRKKYKNPDGRLLQDQGQRRDSARTRIRVTRSRSSATTARDELRRARSRS